MSKNLIQQHISKHNWCHLTIHRPEKANALHTALIDALTDALNKFKTKTPHGITIQASGQHFCAGADLQEMRDMGCQSHAVNRAHAQKLADMFSALDALACPIIVVVQGACFGGALGLVALSDFAFLHTDTYMAFTEVQLGLMPAIIAPYIMRRIGYHKTMHYFLTAKQINAQQAEHIGLATSTCTDPHGAAQEMASILCQYPLHAMMSIKRQLKAIQQASHEMQDNPDLLASIREHPEAQQRLKQFLDQKNK